MDSILNSIKKMLGIAAEYKHFDSDIIMHINSVFMTLNQLGIGPKNGYSILSELETWENFLGESTNLEAVKQYVYLEVKMMFDTSTTSNATLDAMKRQSDELEWRLLHQQEMMNEEE